MTTTPRCSGVDRRDQWTTGPLHSPLSGQRCFGIPIWPTKPNRRMPQNVLHMASFCMSTKGHISDFFHILNVVIVTVGGNEDGIEVVMNTFGITIFSKILHWCLQLFKVSVRYYYYCTIDSATIYLQ